MGWAGFSDRFSVKVVYWARLGGLGFSEHAGVAAGLGCAVGDWAEKRLGFFDRFSVLVTGLGLAGVF